MVIVGVGVMALLELITAGTMSNIAGTELTTAVNLANNIHEITIGMKFQDPTTPSATTHANGEAVSAYTDIWDMNGDTYSPPLDVQRNPIATYANWAQQVTVQSVDPNNLTAVRPNDPVNLSTARVTVVITRGGKSVYTASWLVTAPNN